MNKTKSKKNKAQKLKREEIDPDHFSVFELKPDWEKEMAEIEYPIGTRWRTVMEQTCTSAPDQFFKKAEFLEWSEYWNRINGKGRVEYVYRKFYTFD